MEVAGVNVELGEFVRLRLSNGHDKYIVVTGLQHRLLTGIDRSTDRPTYNSHVYEIADVVETEVIWPCGSTARWQHWRRFMPGMLVGEAQPEDGKTAIMGRVLSELNELLVVKDGRGKIAAGKIEHWQPIENVA